MSSNSNATTGFSREWMEFYLKDREGWPRKRLEVEYECTYLNRETLRGITRILDAGCGGGFLVRYLEQTRGAVSYVGIDRSNTSVTAARERFPDRLFLLTDAQQLPFDTDAFDLAYSRDVVIHVPSPYDAMRELYRVARSVLLRIRTAEIAALFTARYATGGAVNVESANSSVATTRRFAHEGGVHHFFPLEELLTFVKRLNPAPGLIRYRIHRRYPRVFDAVLYQNQGGFSSYWVTDVLIAKGPPTSAPIPVIDDTNHSIFQGALRRLRRVVNRPSLGVR